MKINKHKKLSMGMIPATLLLLSGMGGLIFNRGSIVSEQLYLLIIMVCLFIINKLESE